VLADGDALTFGSARCRIGGIAAGEVAEAELPRSAAPELTRRELDVITSLCRPALSDDAFVTPATAREIAADLVVTEAAVKQHLLRLYTKLRIPEGVNRRIRLANEVVALGLARPQLPEEQRGQAAAAQSASGPARGRPGSAVPRQQAGRGKLAAGPGSAEQRPAQAKPGAGAPGNTRSDGARPVAQHDGSRPVTRPAGQPGPPDGSRPVTRPAGQPGQPDGSRPAARLDGSRPVTISDGAQPTDSRADGAQPTAARIEDVAAPAAAGDQQPSQAQPLRARIGGPA
jgi:hypothetical protein